jgi:hypothetical protein
MGYTVTHSLAEYPAWQAVAAANATARPLIHVATGEGRDHTYGIIERYIPSQIKPMNAAHQQHKDINFAAVDWLHVPVAMASMLFVAALFAHGIWRRQFDDLTLLAATAKLCPGPQCCDLRGDIGAARSLWREARVDRDLHRANPTSINCAVAAFRRCRRGGRRFAGRSEPARPRQRGVGTGFCRNKRETFARKSCSERRI